MRGRRFPIVVIVAAVVLVLAVGSVGALTRHSNQASAPTFDTTQLSGQLQTGQMPQIPPELQGLHSLPPAQRFDHFVGAQVNLRDKNNNPFTVYTTPGKVTSVSLSNMTIAGNDGTTKTYLLSDSTAIWGRPAPGQTKPTVSNGDLVVVVTFNNDNNAWAIMDGGADGSGFGHGGAGGRHDGNR
jgi:hypothetical protein